jgi:hypothetical protein
LLKNVFSLSQIFQQNILDSRQNLCVKDLTETPIFLGVKRFGKSFGKNIWQIFSEMF